MKIIIIILSVLLVAVIVLGVTTKLGYLPNYFEIEILYSDIEAGEETNGLIPHGEYGKPVIYLYPPHTTEVDVEVNFEGEFLVTYPDYNNGWHVIAHPNGMIVNTTDNKEYSYLFWEGVYDSDVNYDMTKGFVVEGYKTSEFLREKLSEIGLTPKEYNEFIVYWMPKMIENNYNLIHFASKDEYADKVNLKVSPQPDSVLRVLMVYKALDERIDVISQEIDTFERNGFTVVEWGGTELK